VGVVDAIGNNVDPSWIGKRVCSLPYFSGPYGEHGEFAIVNHNSIVEAYKSFSDIEAASVMGQYTTAYFGLIRQGAIDKDSKILISAATSTAGIAAIKVAKMMGSTTICTTRQRESRDFLFEMGASQVLISEEDDFPAAIRDATGDQGIDVVFDPINGQFFNQYLYSLADNARIILYGGIDDSAVALDLEAQLELTKRNATLRFLSVQNYADQMDEAIQFIESGFDKGDLIPVIDKTFTFEDFQDAYVYMASKRSRHGKIVLTIN
jgi:NADPH:quinone reductase-like Zn-dependent oxidoreductase